MKAKIRALTSRTSQQNPRDVLIRLNQIMRGWANYFKHAVCKHTLHSLAHFAWWRVVQWWRTLHRWSWKDVRRRLTTPDGRWRPITAGGIELFNLERYRLPDIAGEVTRFPTPGLCVTTSRRQELWRARCGESRTPGSASGLGKRAGSNPGTAPQADSTTAVFAGGSGGF